MYELRLSRTISNINFQVFLSSISYITHPEGLHNLRPGGSSSRLLRGVIPAAACMMVMNFLYFISKVLWFFYRSTEALSDT